MSLLLLLLLTSSPTLAADVEVDSAVELLSRYPMGHVPVEPTTMGAIWQIGESGGRSDVGVLRSLVEHERGEIRSAAMVAIDAVRGRQRAAQRAAYSQTLPDESTLRAVSTVWRRVGLGDVSAQAAAYAGWVLGEQKTARPGPQAGDARRLLASGQPRKALAALAAEGHTDGDLALLATAREDAGDVRGALQAYVLLSLTGDTAAEVAMTEHGVNVERLYLGLLVMEHAGPVGDEEPRLLEALVRSGGSAAVDVLAERMFSAGGSERASAADALIRMLEREDFAEPARAAAHGALLRAVKEGPPPVRDIAASAL